jgi:serine/threonine-protein kinase SRPK3
MHTIILTLLEPVNEIKYNLEQLLQELYFDPDRAAYFSQQDITRLAGLIGKLLRYDPSSRATAAEISSDDWFRGIRD